MKYYIISEDLLNDAIYLSEGTDTLQLIAKSVNKQLKTILDKGSFLSIIDDDLTYDECFSDDPSLKHLE